MKNRKRILILDDEESIIQALGKVLRNQGYQVIACLHLWEAVNRLEDEAVDLAISDLKMPEMTGIEFLIQLEEKYPNAARILLIDPGDSESAVTAINRGKVDWYLEKPWDEEIVKMTIATALKYKRILMENKKLHHLLRKQDGDVETLEGIT